MGKPTKPNMSTLAIKLEHAIIEHIKRAQHDLPLTPRENILRELQDSDDGICDVPVDWALENAFKDFSVDRFCSMFGLKYEVVTFTFQTEKETIKLDRAYYRFTYDEADESL